MEFDFDVAILGLGGAGLATALDLHAAGCHVLALDVSPARVLAIVAGLVDLDAAGHRRLEAALTHPGFQLSADASMLSRALTVVVSETASPARGRAAASRAVLDSLFLTAPSKDPAVALQGVSRRAGSVRTPESCVGGPKASLSSGTAPKRLQLHARPAGPRSSTVGDRRSYGSRHVPGRARR